jgi:predicted  nucleic acid-binding Zn-ribbon protein
MAMKQEQEIQELKKQVAALQAQIKAVAAKCDSQVQALATKCDATQSAPEQSGDWVDRRTFKIWQRKVARKLGWEL